MHSTSDEKRIGVHILTPRQPIAPIAVTEAYTVSFENGYGASIIIGSVSFGYWELAVIHGNELCYATPVTSDVLRVDQFDELESVLDTIAQLPRKDDCTHARNSLS